MNIENRPRSKNVRDIRGHANMPLSHYLGEQVPNHDLPRTVSRHPIYGDITSRAGDGTVEMTPELVQDLQWRGHRTLNDWLAYQDAQAKLQQGDLSDQRGAPNQYGWQTFSEKELAERDSAQASSAQRPGMAKMQTYWDAQGQGWTEKEEAYRRYIEDKLKRGSMPTEQEIRYADDLGIYPDSGFSDEGFTLDPRPQQLRMGNGRP